MCIHAHTPSTWKPLFFLSQHCISLLSNWDGTTSKGTTLIKEDETKSREMYKLAAVHKVSLCIC